jgi:hypothetical protein
MIGRTLRNVIADGAGVLWKNALLRWIVNGNHGWMK